MLLSILIPTQASRRAFWRWLAWNVSKQKGLDWSGVEVVIDGPLSLAEGWHAFALTSPRDPGPLVRSPLHWGEPLGVRRNALVREAQGEYVCWFDDDDWHHPNRLERQLELATRTGAATYAPGLGYMDLATERQERLTRSHAPVTYLGPRQFLLDHPFPPVAVGSDTQWAKSLPFGHGPTGVAYPGSVGPLFVALRHGANTNAARLDRWRFPLEPGTFQAQIGAEAWGDTDRHLDDLRTRLKL